MSELTTPDADKPKSVKLGKGDSAVRLTMSELQAVYHELTNKQERVIEEWEDFVQVELNDLRQLDAMINQVNEQYHVKAATCSITVVPEDGPREQFSSFERFLLQAESCRGPIRGMGITYSFLIVPPKANEPQNYELTVDITSAILAVKDLKENVPHELWEYIRKTNVRFSLEYVDYMVSRAYLDAVTKWVEDLEKGEIPIPVKWIKAGVSKVGRIFKYGFSLAALYFLIYWAAENAVFLSKPEGLFSTLLISASLLFCIFRFSGWLVQTVSKGMSGYFGIGYIKLSKADDKEISVFKSRNRLSIGKSAVAAIGLVIQAFVVDLFVNSVLNWFMGS